MFSKHELFSLDQAHFSLNPFQILILQYPIPRSTMPPSLSCPTPFDYTPQLLDIPNQMPSQANQIHYQTTYKSFYLIGQTNQKAESLTVASLSKLDNTINNSSICNTKCAEFQHIHGKNFQDYPEW